jgi:hypothetical protein
MRTPPLPVLLARLGLAFCFLGFGIWELVAPRLWTAYLPSYLSTFHPIALILIHGAVLTFAALGVLSGWRPKFFTALAALVLFDICLEVFLQDGFTDVFIRDIGLLLFTLGLTAEAWQKPRA